MKANWIIVCIVSICVVILVIFLVWKNRKDEKELTDVLNKDFKNVNNREPEIDDGSEY